MDRFAGFLAQAAHVLRPGDEKQLEKAFAMTSCATGVEEQEVNLCVERASILVSEMGLGYVSLCVALLSEPYQAKKITRETVVASFSKPMADLLDGYSAITNIHLDKASYHSDNFIRLLLILARDVRVVLVKLADILQKIRNIERFPKPLHKKIAGEAYTLYAPIAHRLGLYKIKTELEDRAMNILYRQDHLYITKKLKETTNTRNNFIREFIRPIEKRLFEENFDFEVKGRPKSVHSIWMKMKKQQVPFEEVFDILAIRIILNSVKENEKSDCWKVYSLVTDIYSPNPARLRDWISAPKASGYEALHTTVQGPSGKWVEVQIRSRRMDEIAEKGSAAHWKYKENRYEADNDAWLVALREKLENPEAGVPEEEELLIAGFDDPHIFAFTPQGDLKRLEAGATVLDFAFDIHSDLGSRCSGAKVNGRIVPIKHVLQNGDRVEILTSKNQKPSLSWLKFVVSARTRQKIRKMLRDEEMKEADAGKELLLRKLKNWKITNPETTLDTLVKTLKFPTHLEMYQAVATGKVEIPKIKELLLKETKEEPPASTPVSEEPEKIKKVEEHSADVIYLDHQLVNINYSLAKCCKPVFGDDVFGFVTISKGVTVHRRNCPNAKDLQRRYNYRIVRVKWRKTSSESNFQTGIRIQGIDEMGILNNISDVITHKLGMNIRNISIDSNKGLFKGLITVFVKDNNQLEMCLRQLMKVKGVTKVARQE
jgi:GTP diphosphokinase / guanosine-3',5'-bis(diphosphate) 3'-diphosphatase